MIVILESPFAGKKPADTKANKAYARRCMRDSLLRGEAPLASHLLYTQAGVLDDEIPAERKIGIKAGHAWLRVARKSVVYMDRGVSHGMSMGIEAANKLGVQIEYRFLDK